MSLQSKQCHRLSSSVFINSFQEHELPSQTSPNPLPTPFSQYFAFSTLWLFLWKGAGAHYTRTWPSVIIHLLLCLFVYLVGF